MNILPHQVSPFWSYGFRPFFFSAALFAGIAIPVWVWSLSGAEGVPMHYLLREWHVHEMVFGFLPCVITGFLLTAIPNWTDRPPMRGFPLMLLWALWLAGRLAITASWLAPIVVAMIDAVFLIVVAGIVWRELIGSNAWDRLPIGVLISLYAGANLLFHSLFLNGAATDLAERMALTLIMVLLAMIGGKITPGFTEDFLSDRGFTQQPAEFSAVDGLAILFIGLAGILWMSDVSPTVTGSLFVMAGLMHLVRMSRWYGWLTWSDPLLFILHVGYGWLALSFIILGGAMQGVGLHQADALHALTTGAVGAMTLGVMTRASLGHTGRIKKAGGLTVLIYVLVNLGAILRVFGSFVGFADGQYLGLAVACWSGAYLLFALSYGHILFGQNLSEE